MRLQWIARRRLHVLFLRWNNNLLGLLFLVHHRESTCYVRHFHYFTQHISSISILDCKSLLSLPMYSLQPHVFTHSLLRYIIYMHILFVFLQQSPTAFPIKSSIKLDYRSRALDQSFTIPSCL